MRLHAAPLVFALATASLLLLASAANAQYVGVTSETFDGTQGVFTYNRACHAAHFGSRMCTSEEVMKTVNPPTAGSPGELSWVRPVFQPIATGNTNRFAGDASGLMIQPADLTCIGWSNTGPNGMTLDLSTGSFGTNACTDALKVTCCIPVPEPSASLTIPSGAGMLLVLAKLRGVSLVN
jgi:hypothetical protein